MSYEFAAEIAGMLLAALFAVYARNKIRSAKKSGQGPSSLPPVKKPDLIARTVRTIFKANEIFGTIFGFVIVALIIGAAFYDRLTRIIVLSTIGLMLLIALIARWRRSAKRKKTPPGPHIQIIE